MDTGVQPPDSFVKFDVDDVQVDAESFAWVTDRCFKVTYSEAALGPVDVDLKTLTTNSKFKTALGVLVFPFDKQGYELDVSATADYIDPDLTIEIYFQSTMDQTVTPLTSELNIYADDVLKIPDTVAWTDPLELTLTYTAPGLGAAIIDVELPAATDRLRCLIQNVIPPFRLDDL